MSASGHAQDDLAKRFPDAASSRTVVCMIVEDAPMIALLLEEGFKDAGHQVIGPFSTCAASLEWLQFFSPDVAVLDTTLRDGSCIVLARELRSRNVPFVVYSGDSAHDQNAPEFADVPWIEKPGSFDDLLRTITELAGKKISGQLAEQREDR